MFIDLALRAVALGKAESFLCVQHMGVGVREVDGPPADRVKTVCPPDVWPLRKWSQAFLFRTRRLVRHFSSFDEHVAMGYFRISCGRVGNLFTKGSISGLKQAFTRHEDLREASDGAHCEKVPICVAG